MSRARVLLSQGNPSAALAVLGPFRQQVEARSWQDERLRVMVLQAVALHAHGEKDKAVQLLGEALALAEPGGFIRIFVDEGEPMRLLILDFRLWIENAGLHREGIGRSSMWTNSWRPLPTTLVAMPAIDSASSGQSAMIEPLSERELEILRLIAQGLRTARLASGCSSPWTRLKGTTAKSSTNYKCNAALKPSPAPASWVCCNCKCSYLNVLPFNNCTFTVIPAPKWTE